MNIYSNPSSAVILTGNKTVFLSIGTHLQRRSHPNHALRRVEGKIYRTCAVIVRSLYVILWYLRGFSTAAELQ
jgi:hypothetical protein